MCRSPGPKPIAVFGERSVPARLQRLHHRLLDEPIQHRRDDQRELHLSTASIWDGPRSATHSIRCAVNVSQYSKKRRIAGNDTLILRGLDCGTFSVALEWTDWADPSGDSLKLPLRRLDAESLLALVTLLEQLPQRSTEKG